MCYLKITITTIQLEINIQTRPLAGSCQKSDLLRDEKTSHVESGSLAGRPSLTYAKGVDGTMSHSLLPRVASSASDVT